MTIPSTASLFAIIFWSLDVLQLIAISYEFWFTTVVNAINWITLVVLLGDARMMMVFPGWFSFQIVITMDATYRTLPTAMKSISLSVPSLAILCTVVAFRSLKRVQFFEISIRENEAADAIDIMGFTTSTLSILLVKMYFLKRRRPGASSNSDLGYLCMPCGSIKVQLRLVPRSDKVPVIGSHGQPLHSLDGPHHQAIKLSIAGAVHIDPHRTILPSRYWSSPPKWISTHGWKLRMLLHSTGVCGFVLVTMQSVLPDRHRLVFEQRK